MVHHTRPWRILLLVVAILAAASLACALPGTGAGSSGKGTFSEEEPTAEGETEEAPTEEAEEPTPEETESPTEEPTPVATEIPPTPTPPPSNAVTASNASDLSILRTMTSRAGSPLSSVTFSGDSSKVAAIGFGKTVYVWEIATGKLINELAGPSAPAWTIDWSDDGSKLATAAQDYRVYVWDGRDFSKIATINSGIFGNRVALSADGSKLCVAGTTSSTAKVFDATTGSELAALKPTGSVLWSCNWSPDGRFLAVGTDGGGAFIYDANSYLLLNQLEPTFIDQIIEIEFSKDGSLVGVGYDEGDVGVWQTDNWSRTMHVKHLAPTALPGLMDLAFGVNGDIVAAGGAEGRLVIMAASGGGIIKEVHFSTSIRGMSISPDGSMFAVATSAGEVIIVGLPGR